MESKSDTWHIQEYLIIFVDVLGQSNLLRSMNKFPRSKQEIEKVVYNLELTAGFIQNMRSQITEFYNKFYTPSYMYEGLEPDEKEVYKKVRKRELKHHSFSDLVIIAVPLDDKNERSTSMLGITASLSAISTVMIWALGNSHCLRGGMDTGWCVDLNPNELYGPAIESAYRLEHIHANTPRVLIGDSLIEYIETLSNNTKNTPMSNLAEELANFSKQYITTDTDDNKHMVDFLCPFQLDLLSRFFGSVCYKDELLIPSYNFINNQCDNWLNKDNNIYTKYLWLQKYFRLKIPNNFDLQ